MVSFHRSLATLYVTFTNSLVVFTTHGLAFCPSVPTIAQKASLSLWDYYHPQHIFLNFQCVLFHTQLDAHPCLSVPLPHKTTATFHIFSWPAFLYAILKATHYLLAISHILVFIQHAFSTLAICLLLMIKPYLCSDQLRPIFRTKAYWQCKLEVRLCSN
jgi:hypothetical protein